MASEQKKTGMEGLSSLIKDVESSLPGEAASTESSPEGSTPPRRPESTQSRQSAPRPIFQSEPPPDNGSKKAWPKVVVSLLTGMGLGAGLLFLLQQQGFAASGSTAPVASSEDALTIRQEIESLKAELAEVRKKQLSHDVDKLFRNLDQSAFLRPSDEGYSVVRFDLGVLTVQLVDVTTYANGSKATLRFGNPLSSTVNGLEAKLEYGPTDEKGLAVSEKKKSKDVKFSESLRSGKWTTVSVVLEGVQPSDLGFVSMEKITHSGIELGR